MGVNEAITQLEIIATNMVGRLAEGANNEGEALYKASDIFSTINNM